MTETRPRITHGFEVDFAAPDAAALGMLPRKVAAEFAAVAVTWLRARGLPAMGRVRVRYTVELDEGDERSDEE